MARSRNIKLGFFKNETLAECSPLARLLFSGLWCLADRAGRLEDRPKRIRAEVLPYDDGSVDDMINELQQAGFILRYRIGEQRFIQVLNFSKHQNPHCREPESTIPAPGQHHASMVQEQEEHRTGPADSGFLIPDSLDRIPDSLCSTSADHPAEKKSLPAAKAAGPKKSDDDQNETALQAACKATWIAYASAYFDRYGTEPVRNAKVSSNVKQFVQRIGFNDAPLVAAWFVQHSDAYYVRKMHDVGSLLGDAEKLRTQWATGHRMTATAAMQADRTASNLDASREALAILKAEGLVA